MTSYCHTCRALKRVNPLSAKRLRDADLSEEELDDAASYDAMRVRAALVCGHSTVFVMREAQWLAWAETVLEQQLQKSDGRA